MSYEQPEKLDLHLQDVAEDKRQELLRLFQEIRTEGGKLDFDRLKLALGEADCFKAIQTPASAPFAPTRRRASTGIRLLWQR